MADDKDKPKKPSQITIPVRTPVAGPGGTAPPATTPASGGPAPSTTGLANQDLFSLAHPNDKEMAKWSGREALRQVLSDLGIADELPTNLSDIEDTAQKILRWGADVQAAQQGLNTLLQKGANVDPRKVGMQMRVLAQAQDDLANVKQQFSGFMDEYLHPATGRPTITDDPGRVREREFIFQKTGRQMPITGEDWEAIAKSMVAFKDAKTNENAKQRPDQRTIQALDDAEKLYGAKFQEYSDLIFGGGGRDMIKTPDGRYIDRNKLPGAKGKGSWPTDIKPGWFTEMGATDEPTGADAKLYSPTSAGGMGMTPGEVAAKEKMQRAKATAQAALDQEGGTMGGHAVGWVRDRGSLRPVGGPTTGALQAS